MSTLFSNVEQSKILLDYSDLWASFPDGLVIKNLPAHAGDMDSMPGFGRAPGIGNGNLLQYVLLGKSRDRGAWRATGVAKSWTRLSDCTCMHACIVDLQCYMSFRYTAKLVNYTYKHSFFRFFSLIGHYGVWSRVACAIQQVLVFIYLLFFGHTMWPAAS